MTTLLVIVGIIVVAIGAWGVVHPTTLLRFAQIWKSPTGLYSAAAIRLGIGGLCLLAAGESRFPITLQVIGVVIVAAGVAVLAMGVERLSTLVDWWTRKPSSWLRLACLISISLGAFLIYAAS